MTTWRGGSEEIWRKYPGFVVSGVLHGLGLLALVVSFTRPEKFPEPTESVQVDMLTLSQFDEVMNGEKTGKLMPKPERRVDKVAEIEDHKPATPLAEAKKDTPSEDSPDKPSEDPGQAAKTQAAVAPPPPAPPVPVTPPSPAPPPPVAAVEPPKPEPPKPVPPPEPAKPAPLPPQRPVAELEPVKPEAAKPDAPTPPPKPDEVKPPPPEAEIVAPKPPPRPKIEPKKEVKQDAKPKVAKVKPVSRPRPPVVKEARIAPEPPPKVVEPPPTPPVKPDLVDRVANLLNAMKPTLPKFDTPKPTPRPEPTPEPPKVAEQPKPAEKARAGNAVREAKARDNFSLAKISALLDREPAQRKASTGKQLTQMASLGAPNGHADRMSPSMKSQLDNWLIDHYRGCWTYIGLGATQDYVPTVRVVMAPDGSLIGRPSLTNPTSDPNLRSLADSAIRAVNRCNPMDMPDRFKPFYDSWRDRLVRFDPKEMS